MFGIGNLIEKVFDKIGAPEWLGDVAGIVVDAVNQDWVGVVEGGMDLAENAGIDVASYLPEPLYRAGMAYLRSKSDQPFSALFDGEGFSKMLKDEALREWAGEDGAKAIQLASQILREKGIKA